MKNIKAVFMLFAISIFAGSPIVNAQDKKPDEVKQMIESQNYIFKARTVLPQNSISRQLTSDYDLTITKDSVISFLPYFGRAYSAPIGQTDGGIKFTSTQFAYNKSVDGKGWEITIKPKDASEVQQLFLNIFDNGSARLQVISTNRQTISFEGYVVEGKERGKKAF